MCDVAFRLSAGVAVGLCEHCLSHVTNSFRCQRPECLESGLTEFHLFASNVKICVSRSNVIARRYVIVFPRLAR